MIPREFLGAFKRGHRPSAREFIDEELSYKLLKKVLNGCDESKMALAFITKFNNEFHKNVIKKGDPNALHNTDELRRDLYARENSRNRDLFSKTPMNFLDEIFINRRDLLFEDEESDF